MALDGGFEHKGVDFFEYVIFLHCLNALVFG